MLLSEVVTPEVVGPEEVGPEALLSKVLGPARGAGVLRSTSP
ncbi:hypothetical protein [Streptomyces spongiicola]|nr:hypothetical protein [Streptomyces spongiicola]